MENEEIRFSVPEIWLDYEDRSWIFHIQDASWSKEELNRLKNNRLTVWFVSKDDVDVFLLQVFDALETSDIPLAIEDADEHLLKSLDETYPYSYECRFEDESGKVQLKRGGQFSKANSSLLRKHLKNELAVGTKRDFDKAYARLAETYEPYQLEDFALFTEGGEKK